MSTYYGETLDPALMDPVQRAEWEYMSQIFGMPGPSQASLDNAGTYIQNQADEQTYLSDLSWLNPMFQAQPTLLGQSAGSQVYADPSYIGAQNSALSGFQQLGSTPLSFQSPAQQQAVYDALGGLTAPTFMGNGAQQGIINQIGALQTPTFMGNGAQQAIINQIGGLAMPEWVSDAAQQELLRKYDARIAGEGAPEFDKSGRQEDQYGNLEEIIDGRGATEIEMARRQRQRADQDQWLRSQREATQQDYAERGLTGSGSELLDLSEERQASAGRNSLADLDTAAWLEQRRDAAINNASTLATNMRQQTYQEQSYLDQAMLAALSGASGLASTIRQQGDYEASFDAQYALDKLMGQGNLTTAMRGQDFNEKSFTADYDLRKLTSQGDLTTAMRGQDFNEKSFSADYDLRKILGQGEMANALRRDQYTEQIGQRDADLRALQGYSNLATSLRDSSFAEGQSRAASADNFAVLNAGAMNAATAGNKAFLQNAYTTVLNNRTSQDIALLGQKTGAASTLAAQDAQLARSRSDAYSDYLSTYLGAATQTGSASNLAHAQTDTATREGIAGGFIQQADAWSDLVATLNGAPPSGGGGGSPSTTPQQGVTYWNQPKKYTA